MKPFLTLENFSNDLYLPITPPIPPLPDLFFSGILSLDILQPRPSKSPGLNCGIGELIIFHPMLIPAAGLIPEVSVFWKQSFLPQQPSVKK